MLKEKTVSTGNQEQEALALQQALKNEASQTVKAGHVPECPENCSRVNINTGA